jgi:hypothetical protein
MRFRLFDEWVQDIPRRYQWLVASINHLTKPGPRGARARGARLVRELTTTHVDYVIVWDINNAATGLLAALHRKPKRVDGVLVYRLTGRSTSRSGHRAPPSGLVHRHRPASCEVPATACLATRANLVQRHLHPR